jgi:hypothetical protein
VITVNDRNPVKENSMSENAIESVKATPEPADAKPKRKPTKKAKPSHEAGQQTQGGSHQQESGSDRHDEARQGRHFARDHGSYGLAAAYGAWLR